MNRSSKNKLLALSLTTAISLTLSANAEAANFSFGSQIVDATENGDIAKVKKLISKGTNVNERGEFGTTALMRAAYNGKADLVKALLKEGAQPDIADIGGATPLLIAVREGHNEIVNLLVQAGANVDIADNEGNTPLIRASMAGNEEAAKILVMAGAKVAEANDRGDTALSEAQHSQKSELAQLLAQNENRKIITPLVTTRDVAAADNLPYANPAQLDSKEADIVIDFSNGRFSKAPLAAALPQPKVDDGFITIESANDRQPVLSRQEFARSGINPGTNENYYISSFEYPAQPTPSMSPRLLTQGNNIVEVVAQKDKQDKNWLGHLQNAMNESGKASKRTYELAAAEMVYKDGGQYTLIDLGNFKTKDFADKKIDQIKKDFADVLSGLTIKTVTKGSGANTTYQVNAGILTSRTQAVEICKKLITAGTNCRPVETMMMSQDEFNNYSGDKPAAPTPVAAAPAAATDANSNNVAGGNNVAYQGRQDVLGPTPPAEVKSQSLTLPPSEVPAPQAPVPAPTLAEAPKAPEAPKAEAAPLPPLPTKVAEAPAAALPPLPAKAPEAPKPAPASAEQVAQNDEKTFKELRELIEKKNAANPAPAPVKAELTEQKTTETKVEKPTQVETVSTETKTTKSIETKAPELKPVEIAPKMVEPDTNKAEAPKSAPAPKQEAKKPVEVAEVTMPPAVLPNLPSENKASLAAPAPEAPQTVEVKEVTEKKVEVKTPEAPVAATQEVSKQEKEAAKKALAERPSIVVPVEPKPAGKGKQAGTLDGDAGKFEVARPVKVTDNLAPLPATPVAQPQPFEAAQPDQIETVGSREIWVKVEGFDDQATARNFWNSMRAQNASLTSYRMRTVSSLMNYGKVSAEIGPFANRDTAREACSAASAQGVRCVIRATLPVKYNDIISNVTYGHHSGGTFRNRGVVQTHSSRLTQTYAAPAAAVQESGYWAIQLGSYNTEAEAKAQWAKYSKQSSLRGVSHEVVEVNGKYRLRAGSYESDAKAEDTCQKLRAKGISCIMVRE